VVVINNTLGNKKDNRGKILIGGGKQQQQQQKKLKLEIVFKGRCCTQNLQNLRKYLRKITRTIFFR
jgi:hypothetical protein